MNRDAIIGELARKYGVLLDKEDPAFLIADIVLIMLESKQSDFDEQTTKLLGQFDDSITTLTEKASVMYASKLSLAVKNNIEQQLLPPLVRASKTVEMAAGAFGTLKIWIALSAVGGASLAVLGVKLFS